MNAFWTAAHDEIYEAVVEVAQKMPRQSWVYGRLPADLERSVLLELAAWVDSIGDLSE